jgi:hypothetical protein
MNLQRLREMGIAELAYRSRQEAYKVLERATANGNKAGPADEALAKLLSESVLQSVSSDARDGDFNTAIQILWGRFQKDFGTRFFESAGITPALLKEKIGAACEPTIAAADENCAGRFDLLGYRGVFFGYPIDWHLDPISGQRSPLVHWSLVKTLDPAVVGDSKVVWELNRHQWLVHLGQAYRLTGDPGYAAAFAQYLREWLEANPPGVGINWASSLEAALRIISWSWALFFFQSSEKLSPELFGSIVQSISFHAVHVEKYMSLYFAPNTHLTGEALGLFYAGTLFPDLQPSARWRDLGARILIEQCEEQILPDGVYFEQSTCYQRYTAETYLHFLILAERNGFPVPPAVKKRIACLLDFLLALRRPNGSMPQVGDADGGWLLPLAIRAPDDCRGVFSVAAALFGREDYAWAAGGVTPELLWLLGTEGLKTFESLRAAPPKFASSRVFPHGGYVIMQSGWNPDAHQLVFDAGPLSSAKSGHGHADLLSVQYSAFGEPYLVDPGTYCYTIDRDWRDFFRSTAAHNTVTVDGTNQATPAGHFIWKDHPRARLRRALSTETYDLADAEHDAYRDLADPVIHRRRVIFVKPRYCLIVDDLQGTAVHRIEARFQFAPLKVTIEPNHWVRAYGATGHALLIRSFASVPFTIDLVEGSRAPIQGWVSPDYGRRLAAPALVWSAESRLPLRLVTLLLPVEDASAPCPDVLQLLSAPIGPAGLIFCRDKQKIIFRENTVVLKQESADERRL